jgi:hypothetical protein
MTSSSSSSSSMSPAPSSLVAFVMYAVESRAQWTDEIQHHTSRSTQGPHAHALATKKKLHAQLGDYSAQRFSFD